MDGQSETREGENTQINQPIKDPKQFLQQALKCLNKFPVIKLNGQLTPALFFPLGEKIEF